MRYKAETCAIMEDLRTSLFSWINYRDINKPFLVYFRAVTYTLHTSLEISHYRHLYWIA